MPGPTAVNDSFLDTPNMEKIGLTFHISVAVRPTYIIFRSTFKNPFAAVRLRFKT